MRRFAGRTALPLFCRPGKPVIRFLVLFLRETSDWKNVSTEGSEVKQTMGMDR